MSYKEIRVPFERNLRDMSKEELKRYFRWFIDVIPERINELARAVRSTSGFEEWQPDYTPASLDALGEWFAGEAELRQLNVKEIQTHRDHLPWWIEAPTEDLTSRTSSLGIDVGIYLSQVLLGNHPSIRWEQPMGSKKYAEYGWPVLTGLSGLHFNPMRIGDVIARKFARKANKQLRDVYDIWAEKTERTPNKL
ncbi:MAG TPA: hypothetical protein VJX67_08875 [Blastocatellia bacterium]|nr:hypothetical protein [Blastocatellia bacterium]